MPLYLDGNDRDHSQALHGVADEDENEDDDDDGLRERRRPFMV